MTDVEQPTISWDNNLKKMTVMYKGEVAVLDAGDLNEAQNKANDWLREHGATIH